MREGLYSHRCVWREFQRVGAAVEKAWSPQVWFLDLGAGDRRLEQVSEVAGGLVVGG